MKKLILILVPVVILGTVAGLALTGVIHIPGISPTKKSNWEATLKDIYKKYGKVESDAVVLSSIPKAEFDKFVTAATTAGFKPTTQGERVKSAELVAFLGKDAGTAAKPSPSPSPSSLPEPAPAVKKDPVNASDPTKGTAKVAELWNAIDVAKLEQIVSTYKDDELAKILLKMDTDQVAELLSRMDAKRAARISAALQKEGSTLPSAG